MKTVFSSNSELVHVWANNNDASVYKRANSVSCQYGRLYSYSTCIAEIYNDAVIFNNHSYSNSTSKHQSHARSAIHGLKIISLDIPSYNLNTLIFRQNDFNEIVKNHNEEKAADFLLKASRSKKYADFYQSEANSILLSLADYADLFGLEYQCNDLEAIKEKAIIADKRKKAADKIRKAEKIKEQAEALEAWRAGEDKRHNFEITALRINGENIETTKGAKIPVTDAISAWPLLNRLSDSGLSIKTVNHSIRLGYYTVSGIDKNNLIVGCHTIPMREVKNIAQQLNLKAA